MTDGGGLKGSVKIVEPTSAERAIARRAAETRATVPDIELVAEIDMGAAMTLAEEHSASITALLVRAAALALREHPHANGAYRDGRCELYSRINAGIVMATEEQYEIATILDADTKSLPELTAEIGELESRAGALSQPDRSGATFTLAHYPVTLAHAMITPPNAVAFAAGEVREVPIVRDGAIVPAPGMALTLACDHRILYGARAVGLVARIRDLLERADL
jgi:pyruvate dehydrogenase E2 component (dihydrolipoamide acetyltransferase)